MHPAVVSSDDNQFIRFLVDSLAVSKVEVVPFTWKTAFFSKYDILHFHWPEYLISSPKKIVSLIKGPLVILLIFILRIRRIPILWTVHNLEPHENKNIFFNFLFRFVINSVSSKIYMHENALFNDHDHYVPHGNYDNLFQSQRARPTIKKSCAIVFFGYIRPYKNIENLMKYFPSDLGDLVIAGKPITADYGRLLQNYLSEIDSTGNISLQLKQLSQAELIDLIRSAEIAIFPYRKIYNSGAVLLALSAPIPIIVTDSPSMRELQIEVGAEWLAILPTAFGKLDIQNAVKELRASAPFRRQLSPLSTVRGWEIVGRRHLKAYEDAVTRY